MHSTIINRCSIKALTPLLLVTQWAVFLNAQPNSRVIQTVTTTVTRNVSGIVTFNSVGAGEPAYAASHVLVRFRHGAPATFLPGSGPTRSFPNVAGLYMVQNPLGVSISEAIRRYKTNPNVLYAEPDYVVKSVATPNDPMWTQQWDMAKIAAPAAWEHQTSAIDVVVAVIDTGIDYTHPELQGNLWSDPANAGSHGYTCINGTCSPGGLDDYGHGTHVAGTIGAVGNNGVGIAGINWGVQLLSCKFLDSTGSGQTSDAVLCFNQVLALRQQGINVRVTSNSWGGGGFSQALQDAMSAVESAGIVNVCAAGNSGVNADVSPMYPAAFNNRGIISVLASDSNDAGAYFTNYGLASVDIAAPGVSTLSTVPTGTCALCDPSGYKFLSGTSMATPHVSGVVAALLHMNPALTAAQARDVVLDPASYDALTDPLAQSTSTGGRLNFAKAIANPLVVNPKLNNFPALTMPANVFANAGAPVILTPTLSDPDDDRLRMAWSKPAGSAWLFGWMLNNVLATSAGSSVSFTAPTLARTATAQYDFSVADGRGGSAEGSSYVTVSPVANPAAPPYGSLSVSSTTPAVGNTITVNFPVTAPAGGQTGWDLWVSSGNMTMGLCCYTGASTGVTLNSAGVYGITAQAIDSQLNLSARNSVVVLVGGATGNAPVAAATLSALTGAAPLTVNIDMSASYVTGGIIQYYYMDCGGGTPTPGAQPSSGSCTFTTPGAYWLRFQVQDNNGNVDTTESYVVATPSGTSDSTSPPVVSITSPTGGSAVSGSVSVSANASDSLGISKVDFYLDSGMHLGAAATAPYAVMWNSANVSPGPHSVSAIATDMAGNTGNSAPVAITVAAPPAVTITSPVANSVIAGNIYVSASASSTLGIKSVNFYIDAGILLGTATISPYSVVWNSAAVAPGTHTLYAIATDTAGTTTTSALIPVTVPAPPVVSITSPAANAIVLGNMSVAATASSAIGIRNVAFYVDAGVLIGTASVSPYAIAWNSGSVPAGAHTVYALATDSAGNTALSATAAITVAGPPKVSITTQPSGTTVARKTSLTMSASVTSGGFPISRVDFMVNSTVVCSDVASPYSCVWQAPSAVGKTYQLSAKAYDTQGQSGLSNTVTITSQ